MGEEGQEIRCEVSAEGRSFRVDRPWQSLDFTFRVEGIHCRVLSRRVM